MKQIGNTLNNSEYKIDKFKKTSGHSDSRRFLAGRSIHVRLQIKKLDSSPLLPAGRQVTPQDDISQDFQMSQNDKWRSYNRMKKL
jgi:hypothetical protein